jgi:uncharacterized protein YjiK
MRTPLIATAVLLCASVASAQTSINLANYTLQAVHPLAVLGEIGLEASAVTYARDRGSLFVVGDEGLGVAEFSKAGATLGSMGFTWPVASTNNDAEGLAYLGRGALVVVEERLQDAYRFDFVNGAIAELQNADFVSFGATAGNVGTEGISVDPRNGRFVTVKQQSPQAVLEGSLTFAAPPAGGISGMSALFDPAVLNLPSLSDVQTLSPVDALNGTAAADNLLILSYNEDANVSKLVEVNRSGTTLSSFDLRFLAAQIEGVTIDEKGVIYLVAEGDSIANPSKLFVLAPVPEPETYAMLLSGLTGLCLRLKVKRLFV